LAEERHVSGSPRRTLLLIGLGVLVVLGAVVALVLTLGDDGAPPRAARSGGAESVAEIPEFRFQLTRRELVPTSRGPLKKREKVAGKRAAAAAADLLTDLYREGFLDPANWQVGSYGDAFQIFASGAAKQAKARAAVLTAGPDAADRYDEILPVRGRVSTRILLDRGGKPALMVSAVRFTARALGARPATLRSEGQFFFKRVDGRWKVVSFLVTRDDMRRQQSA
jgi:hypothetical protein